MGMNSRQNILFRSVRMKNPAKKIKKILRKNGKDFVKKKLQENDK